MSRYVFKLPDLGEGTVEAEIVGWRVKPGDTVAEDDVIVEVMTEKAAVELPSPVSGRVLTTTGGPGDLVPVGADLIVFETQATEAASSPVAATVGSSAAGNVKSTAGAPEAAGTRQAAGGQKPAGARQAAAAPEPAPAREAAPSREATDSRDVAAARVPANPRPPTAHATQGTSGSASRGAAAGNGASGIQRPAESTRVATSPAIRRQAHEAGVDLRELTGSGPNGRILREDLEAFVTRRSRSRPMRVHAREQPGREDVTEEIKVIGVRRVIAQRLSESKRNIPHFAYVEELDVTELEALRRHLNARQDSQGALTYLPFIVAALARVLREFPQCNALYDSERGVIVRHRAVHVGIATQTPDGLKVPVVRHAESLSVWELAAHINRVTEAARTNKATRDELTGSTITITSLGKLGGIATTPIINAPEVSIIGINRATERPVVHVGSIAIRRMMNLSSSFDHRFVDGYDAAAMIQALKDRLEHPATIFIDG